ncbi:hypothetical protein Tco_0248554 [Tanacetum coccineum]
MPPSNKPDIDDTQFTYGSKSHNYSESHSVSNDFVSCETSDKSSDSETTGFTSCVSSVHSSNTMTNASSLVDLKTLHKTDDQRPCNVTQSPSFSFKENVKTPRNLCNRNGSNNIKGIHHHPTTGIFSESTYDADFGGSFTNLAPTIAVDPVSTRRVHTVHPIS